MADKLLLGSVTCVQCGAKAGLWQGKNSAYYYCSFCHYKGHGIDTNLYKGVELNDKRDKGKAAREEDKEARKGSKGDKRGSSIGSRYNR